jgi:hypothetical protein
MIEILVAKVLNTRNVVHLTHWKTTSYAQHIALNEFYDAVVGEIDTIVECYQGAFGLIDVPAIPEITKPKDIAKHLDSEVVWIASNRDKIAKDNDAVKNLIDSLCGLYFKTLYKLRNLD